MSGLDELERLQWGLAEVCPLYRPSSFVGPFLVGLGYFPVLVSLGLYAIGLYCYELYLLALSLGLTFDFLLNWGLREAIGAAPRFAGCGADHGMPAYAAQQTVFFECVVLSAYTCVWRRGAPISTLKLGLLRAFCMLALFAHIYVGSSTVPELLAGAAIGLVEAIAFQFLLCRVVRRHAHRILRWRAVRWAGLQDNLCGWARDAG